MRKSVVAENTKRIICERGLKRRAVAEWAGIPEKQVTMVLCFVKLRYSSKINGTHIIAEL